MTCTKGFDVIKIESVNHENQILNGRIGFLYLPPFLQIPLACFTNTES